MQLNEYQKQAMQTCMDSSANFAYMFLNLVGELGEFASKVAKAIRKEKIHIGSDMFPSDLLITRGSSGNEYRELEDELKKEAGDIIWQLAGLCSEMGWTLEEVAEMNLAKLQARKENGTIDGSGDGVTKEERS